MQVNACQDTRSQREGSTAGAGAGALSGTRTGACTEAGTYWQHSAAIALQAQVLGH